MKLTTYLPSVAAVGLHDVLLMTADSFSNVYLQGMRETGGKVHLKVLCFESSQEAG